MTVDSEPSTVNSQHHSGVTGNDITNQYKSKAEDKGRNGSPNNYLLLLIETE
ncbi:hypothetical protein [Microcoleus sp. AR_TQ3_B6]|uniref:hypothetical protein n=1 Tax=Microcoleus sp. AR_TQ3_B6 TaxID=3055284 RepID=UPI002FD0098C